MAARSVALGTNLRQADGSQPDYVAGPRGKRPRLTPATAGHLLAEFHSDDYSAHELACRYAVGVATLHRAVERAEKSGAAAAVTLTLPRADSDAR